MPADAAAADVPMRVILIRHGRPAIPTAPRTSHREFRSYIDAYEEAGLDPESMPPEELQDLLGELDAVFTSERKRSVDSARALAPHAELIADPLFAEAPLASPPIPLLKMKVPKWAVVARILWHAGYHPEIENYRRAKHRAVQAADILVKRAADRRRRSPRRARLFQLHHRPRIAPPRISEVRLAQSAVLEFGGLRAVSVDG